MPTFIAVDVETANSDQGSICSIGLISFAGGALARRVSYLVNPEDHFDGRNIAVHGITPAHVANAPTLREIYPLVASAMASAVVAHHSPFDRIAFHRASERVGHPPPDCRWIDTCCVARRAWQDLRGAGGYGLATLAQRFDISFQHHDAAEDAHAAGLVFLRAIADSGLSVEDWLTRVTQPVKPKPPRTPKQSRSVRRERAAEAV
jgi:DNA polymerase-3 subunit epsilon